MENVNIRTLRLERNLSQQKLARLLGVSVGAISRWEKGTRNPSRKNIIKIIDILNTDKDKISKDRDEIVDKFANTLKNRRIELNLGIPDLARIMDKPQKTIQNWENGVRLPAYVSIKKLSEALDLDYNYLCELRQIYRS